MHKVFISYHHKDQRYKDCLVKMARRHRIFIDKSVDTGDINEDRPAQRIREIIRDDYLKDSTVTIVLVGSETKRRKHVDWEIYSSMLDGKRNKKSGILVITLCDPERGVVAPREGEERIHSDVKFWSRVEGREEWKRRFPDMPARIIDNLMKPGALISVVPWKTIARSPRKLARLIDAAFRDRDKCSYDLSRRMRRRNS